MKNWFDSNLGQGEIEAVIDSLEKEGMVYLFKKVLVMTEVIRQR